MRQSGAGLDDFASDPFDRGNLIGHVDFRGEHRRASVNQQVAAEDLRRFYGEKIFSLDTTGDDLTDATPVYRWR